MNNPLPTLGVALHMEAHVSIPTHHHSNCGAASRLEPPKVAKVVAGPSLSPATGTQRSHSLQRLCIRNQAVLWAMSTSSKDFEMIAPQLQWHVFAHQCGDIVLPQVGPKPYQMRNGHSLYKWDFSSHCHGPLAYPPHWRWSVEGRGAIEVAADLILRMW